MMHRPSGLLKTLCVVFALAFTGACSAQAKTCSPQDAAAAEALVDNLNSWSSVELAFKRYGHCDDGDIAEGNSVVIARLLVTQWKTLPLLVKLTTRDPSLKRFVLRHIDRTLDSDDLSTIKMLASSTCPEGAAALCAELLRAANRATR